jgi:hypothetical protein
MGIVHPRPLVAKIGQLCFNPFAATAAGSTPMMFEGADDQVDPTLLLFEQGPQALKLGLALNRVIDPNGVTRLFEMVGGVTEIDDGDLLAWLTAQVELIQKAPILLSACKFLTSRITPRFVR